MSKIFREVQNTQPTLLTLGKINNILNQIDILYIKEYFMGEGMTQRQEDLVNAAKTGEPHGAAFGMSEKVIKDAAEAKVGVVESALNLSVAKEKVKKSGAGEGFANAALKVLTKMEGWFTKRHNANETNAAGRISKAEEQRARVRELAEAKAAKFARKETYKAASAQFKEVSPKGITLALPEFPNIFKEVSRKYNEWRVKANESKAEIYGNKAERYKTIAEQLRDAADNMRKDSRSLTDSRHDTAESELDAAKLEKTGAGATLKTSMDELKRVQDSDYLQKNASGESSRIAASPDDAASIQTQSRQAWAEQVAPSNANTNGTK